MLSLGLLLGCVPADTSVPSSPLWSESSATEGSQSSSQESYAPPSDTAPESTEPTETTPLPAIERVVIAGDSWSAGSVAPTRALLDLHDYEHIVLAWETTALSGSRASEWAVNHEGKLDYLDSQLDSGEVGAGLLLLYLGGNDYNAALHRGLNPLLPRQEAIENLTDQIQSDLKVLIDHALRDRPGLEIVIVGYDYLHFDWFNMLFGLDLDAKDTLEYNRGFVELEARKLELSLDNERVHYVHNLGILTHTLGNPITPPFTNPLIDVPPGYFDAPVGPPDYSPFPGGARRSDLDPSIYPPESLPGPAPAFLDGVHLNDAGWNVLISHTWESVLGPVVEAR